MAFKKKSMIRFFKFSGPVQFATLLLIAILYKLPLIFSNPPMLVQDLIHLTEGEKMADGFLLYRDIIDNLPPISGLFYCILDVLFSKSSVAYGLCAILLIFFQAVYFKNICNSLELLTEKGDLPALVYIIFTGLFYEMNTLSTALISVTFLIPALYYLLKYLKSQQDEGLVITVGFFLSLSFLSYFPAIVFLILTLLTIITYTRTRFNFYALFCIGFIFPILSVSIFFYLADGGEAFFACFFSYYFGKESFLNSIDPIKFLSLIGFAIILVLIGYIRVFLYRRFIIYQVICQRVFIGWLLLVTVSFLWIFEEPAYWLIMLAPFVTLFISHFFYFLPKNNWGGILMTFLMLWTALSLYSFTNYPYAQYLQFQNVDGYTGVDKESSAFRDKKILVFGEDYGQYWQNTLATPYLNWQMSKNTLKDVGHYENVIQLCKYFNADMPDVIIDKENIMPGIVQRIPFLQNMYISQSENTVYIRKTK